MGTQASQHSHKPLLCAFQAIINQRPTKHLNQLLDPVNSHVYIFQSAHSSHGGSLQVLYPLEAMPDHITYLHARYQPQHATIILFRYDATVTTNSMNTKPSQSNTHSKIPGSWGAPISHHKPSTSNRVLSSQKQSTNYNSTHSQHSTNSHPQPHPPGTNLPLRNP